MQIKNCQNCKKDFNIEAEDFSFYEKMKVPAPTFCKDCRKERRLAWFNLVNLYHRNCDLCHERFISMYPSKAPYVVYCPSCWWSDKWSWEDYSVDYDFSKSFFEQYFELLKKVPLMGLATNTATLVGSPYNNYATHDKDCYLTFNSDYNQECAYGVFVTRVRESFDSSMVMDCDSIYDCACIYKSNRCIGTRGNNRFCVDCSFVRDCENCQDYFMCGNLKNKKYCYKNKQLTKEEYKNTISKYDLGSYSGYQKAWNEALSFWKTISPRPSWDTMSVNYSGSYVFHSKNCHECYDIVDAEDCKFCTLLWRGPQKDCYDVSAFGFDIENVYEGMNIFEHASNIKFSEATGLSSMDIEYSKSSLSSQNNFGCVSVRKGENIIFNKKYSKEDFKSLREKIISHMSDMPYFDVKGNKYTYGEFFPPVFSPFPYNATLAQNFYPKSEYEIKNDGLCYFEKEKNIYDITTSFFDLKDNIKDITDEILNETIGCSECGGGYKIIKMELSFLKKMNLPLPRKCPFCRINDKLNIWVDNMTLVDRICGKCGIQFKTHYSEERAPLVYCKDCYQNEVI